MTPVDVALACGYTIISHNGLTVMEIEEIAYSGDWAKVEKACRRFILHPHWGHAYDHYAVVVRNADGTRELRDVGVNGVRTGTLPSVGFKCKRKYDGCGVKGARADGKRFRCQMTVHGAKLYLGMYDSAEEAGRVRDRYVITHDLRVPLNYPEEVMYGHKQG